MHISDNAHREAECYRNARAESVDAVGEVDRVYRGIDNDKAENPEEYAHLNIAGERNEHIWLVAHAHIERDEISDYNKRLKYCLLLLGQTEVALFDDLYIVIGKADERHAKSKDNTAVELRIKFRCRRAGCAAGNDIAAEELVGNNSHRNRGYRAEDKHESAHGRRALFFSCHFGPMSRIVCPKWSFLSHGIMASPSNAVTSAAAAAPIINAAIVFIVFSSLYRAEARELFLRSPVRQAAIFRRR